MLCTMADQLSTQYSTLSKRVAGLMSRAHSDLADLVALPSVHIDPDKRDDCRASAAWVRGAFADAGIDTQVHDTSDGSQAVIGHRPGPEGSPTVLLYSHHDVQPAGPADQWDTPPFALTAQDGRWFGRGSADCKGNVVAILTALRSFAALPPVGIRVVIEGSEEAGGEGLDHLAYSRPDLFDADMILICDTGNVAPGTPTLTTSLRGMAAVRVSVETLASEVHSGQFGGAAPDALAALIAGLATLRDADGNTTVDGLTHDQVWPGASYDPQDFRSDSTTLGGVDLLGSGSPADMVWARPAVTVIALDAPPTSDAPAAINPRAAALLNLRVPPGMDPHDGAAALTAHLKKHIPWHARVDVETLATGAPFSATTNGPGYTALTDAMSKAYDAKVVYSGQGGSIPLCTVLSEICPRAEIALLGVEEPNCRIHAPNESVDPDEISKTALSLALFLSTYAAGA
jgi:acetylornithine deacetylase/succinyl-diaminopimelate desuccinylase-like protein